MKTSRRHFLARSAATGLVSLGATAPAFLHRAAWAAGESAPADKEGRILVLLELAGGNDGLNTVVPFADDAYHQARPGTALAAGAVLKLDDHLGLHPQMRGMKDLHDAAALTIIQGVGYPNPDRSHFRSMDIWHSARPEDEEFRGDGWLGRTLDATEARHTGRLPALAVGTNRLPRALLAHRVNVPMLRSLDAFRWNPGAGPARDRDRRRELIERFAAAEDTPSSSPDLTFLRQATATAALTARRLQDVAARPAPTAAYPASELGRKLRTVSQLITADLGTRIFFLSLGGFDTHSQQAGAHAALLGELSGAVKAFHDDLQAHQLADRVLLATYSEFGRRVAENGSLGTDHGTASQMFLVTSDEGAKPGLLGTHPSLSDLDDQGDLKFHTDFRSVYATLLEKWLGFPSEPALGARFPTLDVLA